MPLRVHFDPNHAEFSGHVDGFLHTHEPENGLVIGLAASAPPGAKFLRVSEDATTQLAGLLNPGRKLLLSRGPAGAAALLAETLHAQGLRLPGVFAPDENGHAFAEAYARASGLDARIGLRMRVHVIERVAELPMARGRLRLAIAEDHALLARWCGDFLSETGADDPRPPEQMVTDAATPGRLHVWDDGGPATIVAWGRDTRSGAAVHLVYTPPERRGRGYATSAVATLTRQLLAEPRKFVCLFTNLASPAPNAIYAKIGYRGLCDYADHWFQPRG